MSRIQVEMHETAYLVVFISFSWNIVSGPQTRPTVAMAKSKALVTLCKETREEQQKVADR